MYQAPSNKFVGVADANCDVTTVILGSVISLNRQFKCAYYWETVFSCDRAILLFGKGRRRGVALLFLLLCFSLCYQQHAKEQDDQLMVCIASKSWVGEDESLFLLYSSHLTQTIQIQDAAHCQQCVWNTDNFVIYWQVCLQV